jgi:tRNA G18 (ribose-2'-O)-methylase SpoU
MDRIDSTQNPRVKAARALHTVKGRDESGMFLCEGEHMVREAVRAAGEQYALSSAFALGSAFAIDTLFVDEACEEKYADLIEDAHASHAFLVSAQVMEVISTVKSPQGIAAVVRLQTPPITLRNVFGMIEEDSPPYVDDGEAVPFFAGGEDQSEGAFPSELWDDSPYETADAQEFMPPASGEEDGQISPSILGDKLVLLEAVQDPGNVGTILRTMDAAGFSGAILSPGCADPFSPKALRATMGSIFRVPTMQTENAARTAAALAEEGYAVVAAALDGEDFFAREPLLGKVCLIIGNEGAGITRETLAAATRRYRLPMKGGAESLNAAAAAAIMIYDIAYRK